MGEVGQEVVAQDSAEDPPCFQQGVVTRLLSELAPRLPEEGLDDVAAMHTTPTRTSMVMGSAAEMVVAVNN